MSLIKYCFSEKHVKLIDKPDNSEIKIPFKKLYFVSFNDEKLIVIFLIGSKIILFI